MNLKNVFERVVCISLARRGDRRARLDKLAKKNWPFKPIEYFTAVDGGSGRVPMGAGFISGSGAWGCRQSWTRVLEEAIRDNVDSILVLEDDAVWRPDIKETCTDLFTNVPDDWQVVFLGGQNMRSPRDVKGGVGRIINCQRTHAIGIRGEGIRFVYKTIANSDRHIDHILGPACGKHRHCYQPVQFIIGQDATQSDISGRKDHARFWSSPKANYPIVWLNTTEEVADRLREYGVHYGFDLDDEGMDRGLNAMFPKAGIYKGGLGKYLSTVAWEAASFTDGPGIVTIWHPNANETAIIAAGKDVPKRCKISPQLHDTDEVIAWLTGELGVDVVRKREDRRRLPVVLLRSPGSVVEKIRKSGVAHMGRWFDEETGIDKGLDNLVRAKAASLADWFKVLSKEAAETNVPVGIYHPKVTEDLASTTRRDVVVIDATDYEEARRKIEKVI